MTTETEQKGFIIFNDLRDIRMMEEFSDAYHRVFSAQEAIAADHRNIPDLLAIKKGEKKHWMPLCDAKTVGYLPRQLTVSQLKPAHFDDAAESYTVSINQNLTHSAIGLGLNYIDHVEQSAWNRQTWEAFEHIHRPAYYLITLISERVRDLCRFEPSKALVQEYHCLAIFLDRAVGIASNYFSSHDEVEPFHCYLSDVADVVSAMKLRLEFYLERTAMAKNLENMANLLDAYRAGLAIYLTYVITDAPLNEAVHLGQLIPLKKKVRSEKAQTLPTDFRESRIYRNIHRALSGKLDGIVNKTRLENQGVSYLLKKSAKEDEKTGLAVNHALTAYHELLLSLNVLPELIRGLRALSDGAKLQGEYEIVHDEALHATLEVQLLLTAEFLTQSHQRLDKINAQNKNALSGNENFQRGATLNIRSAQRQSERLNQIGRPILENRQAITERIQRIQQLNPDTLKAQRNALLKKTKQLLTQFQKHAILPANELTELQTQLEKVYPQENKGNPSGFSRPIVVSASTTRKNTELENNMQDSVTMPQAPKQDGNSPESNNNRYPFLEIYTVFENQPNADQLCQQFDELIGKLHYEIDVTLSNFITQLEEIHEISEEIEQHLETLSKIDTSSLSGSHYFNLLSEFEKLRALINDTHYATVWFVNFQIIKDIISKLFFSQRTPIIQNLEQSLLVLADQGFQSGHHKQQPSKRHKLSILGYLSNQLNPVSNRIEGLNRKISGKPYLENDEKLVDFFQKKIKLSLQRLPEHERPRLKEPEQVIITGSSTSVIASIKATTPNNTQEQPKIIPATREEVLREFQTFQEEVKKPATLPKKNKKTTLLDNLNEKCNALFEENISAEELKNGLEDLIDFLIKFDYTLNGGGERIKHPVTGKYKKVPFAIKQLAQIYMRELDNVLSSNSEEAMKKLRDSLFESIDFAAKNPNYYFCFYNPRDGKTQAIYQTMVNCYGQHKKIVSSPTP